MLKNVKNEIIALFTGKYRLLIQFFHCIYPNNCIFTQGESLYECELRLDIYLISRYYAENYLDSIYIFLTQNLLTYLKLYEKSIIRTVPVPDHLQFDYLPVSKRIWPFRGQ